jgi:hypothetical protein
MNTAIRFLQVQPRRNHDSKNMKLWACIVGGKIIAYTDEPATLAAGLPRVNSFDYRPANDYHARVAQSCSL